MTANEIIANYQKKKAEPMQCIVETRFYTAKELKEELKWGMSSVYRLFNEPDFPSIELGGRKVVESHALVNYTSVRREKRPKKNRNRTKRRAS